MISTCLITVKIRPDKMIKISPPAKMNLYEICQNLYSRNKSSRKWISMKLISSLKHVQRSDSICLVPSLSV